MIRHELSADTETPVSLFLAVEHGMTCAALFESVEGGERWARRSLIALGREPALVAKAPGDVTGLVRALGLQAKPESLLDGAFGYLSYEAAQAFVPLAAAPSHDRAVAEFFRPDAVLLYDHRLHTVEAQFRDPAIEAHVMQQLGGQRPRLPMVSSLDRRAKLPVERELGGAEFARRVELAKEYIRAGDAFQIVLSQRFYLPDATGELLGVYRQLRRKNPSPYLFYLRTPGLEAAGASPETLVRVEDGTVTLRPIAGTRPRGKTLEEDQALEAALLADPKERAEHLMLVDLGRNDVGRVARPGSVRVAPFMAVERYSHVMHLVSEVQGTLADDSDALAALASAFPAGTLSGAPKKRAMEIIGELEGRPRGLYGGAVGYFGGTRACDFAIAIRAVFRDRGRLVAQAGAGVVYDSDPAEEDRECLRKATSAVLAAGGTLEGDER